MRRLPSARRVAWPSRSDRQVFDGALSFGLDLTRDYAEFGVRMSEVPIVLVNQRPPNSHGVRSQGSPRAGANQSS